MKKIQITRGVCGISYTDEYGGKRHTTKRKEDGPFEYEDEKADRLVTLGVAEYVFDEGEKTAAPKLSELKVKELIKRAEELGVDVSKCKKKDEYLAAIAEAEKGGKGGADPEKEKLLKMSVKQLEQLAEELGINTDTFDEKEQYAEAILAVMAKPGQDNNLPRE